MLDVDDTTSKSGVEMDLGTVNQIITTTLEARMLLLFDFKLDIARLHTRDLVTLAFETDLVAVRNSTVDGHVEHFAFNDGLLALALPAPILVAEDFSLALTVRTDSLKALDHRAHLTHHGLHALAITARAGLDRPRLAAAPFAVGADDGLLEG